MDADEPGFWLPLAHFGSADTPLPKVEPLGDDEDPDDDEDRPTDPYVVMMLGFDPRDMGWDDDTPVVVPAQV